MMQKWMKEKKEAYGFGKPHGNWHAKFFFFMLQNSPVHPAVVSHFGSLHSSASLTKAEFEASSSLPLLL
jgi:hypothetical protein